MSLCGNCIHEDACKAQFRYDNNQENFSEPAIVKEIIMDSKGIKDLYVFGNGFNFENSFDIFYLTHKEAEKALEEKKC